MFYNGFGGHVTKGETPKEAIIRGTMEEIGFDISNEEVKSTTEMMYLIEKGLMHPVHRDIVPKVLKLK